MSTFTEKESDVSQPATTGAAPSDEEATLKPEASGSIDPHEAVRQANKQAQDAVVASQNSVGLA
jgi:DNA-directed RNA polymerase alpha subunit